MKNKKVGSPLFVLFFVFSLSVGVAHAGQCFPQGTISVHVNSTEQTLAGEVSPMGAITIHDPQYGTLNGYVDNLGNFNASNDQETVHGSVDTSCPQTSNSSGNTQGCIAPVTQDCDANALGGITVQQNLSGIGNSSIGQGAIQACNNKHTQYQTELNTYNTCLNTKSQSQSWTPPVYKNSPAPTAPTKTTASCQEQHGIHSVTEGAYCACPLVGYDFDSHGQCIASGTTDDSKKILNPSLVTADILKTVAKVFQTYYPDAITTLSKSVQGYNTNDQSTTSSLSAIEKILQIASNNSDDLNNTYRDKSISNEATNAINSLKQSTTVCLATAQVMLKNDGLDIVQAGLKKCTGWSATLNSALGQSSGASVSSDVTQTTGNLIAPVSKKSLQIPATPTNLAPQNTQDTRIKTITAKRDYTPPASSTQASAYGNNTLETATSTPTVPPPAPIQKHWYEWLNPLNWFK